MLEQSEHLAHRKKFMDTMGPDSAAIFSSPPERLRNGDAHYGFRQSSDLFYLSGFNEPESTILLRPDSTTPYTLIVRERDPLKEVWNGRRAGTEGVKKMYGADAAFARKMLKEKMSKCIANVDSLYYELGVNQESDALLLEVLAELRRGERRGLRPPKQIVDPRFSLHEQRLFKTEAEVRVLQKASDITVEAHVESMRMAQPGGSENEIAGLIDYTFRRRGGSGPGYTSIVGGGKNATILHYIENNDSLKDGELLLIDAGCEYGLYTADVTRTFPVSGTFSKAQARCYQIVLDAQEEAIEMTRPGATIDEIHQRCIEVLTAGMIELGLLKGKVSERIKDESYKRFYMHRTSHWLGIDVHDVGMYTQDGKARLLAPGMVITVEPGLYIDAQAKDVPDEFRGIGIRIEDDLLVTDQGCCNLTAAVPKTIAEIEAACQG